MMSEPEPQFDPSLMRDETLTPFDVGDTSGRQGLVKLLVGFGILLALALIVLKLYQPGVRDRNDPPLITAENTPFKVIPEDVGGTQTPDQDKEVFEVMTGKPPQTEVTTLPSPETPINRPAQSQPLQSQSQPAERQTTQTAPVRTQPAPTRPAASQPVQTQPAPRPTQTQPTRSVASGGYVVQVASLRSRAEAEATYGRISTQYGNILAGYRSDIRRVDLAEKGVYYRARVAGFGSKGEADQVCNRLKAAGQACFVTKG